MTDWTFRWPTGLGWRFRPDGSLVRLDLRAPGVGDLQVNLFGSDAHNTSPHGTWLRRYRRDGSVEVRPLFGPMSAGAGAAGAGRHHRRGRFGPLRWRTVLLPVADVPAFHLVLDLLNDGQEEVRVDAAFTMDVGLSEPGTIAANEYYVSQYLDRAILRGEDGHPAAVALRNNLGVHGRHPWLALTCSTPIVGAVTDAAALAGSALWTSRVPAGLASARPWPDEALAREHAMAGLVTEPVTLAPGERYRTAFGVLVVPDHPDATGPADLAVVAALPPAPADTVDGPEPRADPAPSLYATAPLLTGRQPDGPLPEPSVAGMQDTEVRRPFGQILTTARSLEPDPGVLTTTCWMHGVFASQVTVGDASARPGITLRRSALNLLPAAGMRLFVDLSPDEPEPTWGLLGSPSTWRNGTDEVAWTYDLDQVVVTVTTRARATAHRIDVDVRASAPRRLLLAVHGTEYADTLRITVLPADAVAGRGGDELLAVPRPGADPGTVVVATTAVEHVRVAVTAAADQARTGDDGGPGLGERLIGRVRLLVPDTPDAEPLSALRQMLGWFTHDALVHFLSPRGLEQYTGGLWGTRDVCQGPVGLLTAFDEVDARERLLARVMAAQRDDGSWPQAFAFLPDDDRVHLPAHGDVVLWPLLALAEHVLATGQVGLLHAHRDGLDRALAHIADQVLPGTALLRYGHGDWNDAMQPADPGLATRLVSTWTVTLQYRTLRALADAHLLDPAGSDRAARLRADADRVAGELRDLLMVDGVLPGYVLFAPDVPDPVEVLAHPRDVRTGLRHSLLPTVHAVAYRMLAPLDAARHMALVDEHLLGPDGARLFDRPVPYRGGVQVTFRRAESAAFFGREIGLMYTHSHIRWVEALAAMGDADRALAALAAVCPPITDGLPFAPRQRTCFASSSDADVADRTDADTRYRDVMAGRVLLQQGWRIYSSGPGLVLRVLVESLLGVRPRADGLLLDPVLPAGLDGLVVQVPVRGRTLRLRYAVDRRGCGVRRVSEDGRPVSGRIEPEPYRSGGMLLPWDRIRADRELTVEVS